MLTSCRIPGVGPTETNHTIRLFSQFLNVLSRCELKISSSDAFDFKQLDCSCSETMNVTPSSVGKDLQCSVKEFGLLNFGVDLTVF